MQERTMRRKEGRSILRPPRGTCYVRPCQLKCSYHPWSRTKSCSRNSVTFSSFPPFVVSFEETKKKSSNFTSSNCSRYFSLWQYLSLFLYENEITRKLKTIAARVNEFLFMVLVARGVLCIKSFDTYIYVYTHFIPSI